MSVNRGSLRKYFKDQVDEETGEVDAVFSGFIGNIEAGGFTGNVWLKPQRKFGEKSPDFKILRQTTIGGRKGMYDFGCAWLKTAQAGGEYLSLKFDNELQEKPVYLSGFRPGEGMDEDKDEWPIVWQRNNRKGPKFDTGPKPAEIDDEIPDFG